MKVIIKKTVPSDAIELIEDDGRMRRACAWATEDGFCDASWCEDCPAHHSDDTMTHDAAVKWWEKAEPLTEGEG